MKKILACFAFALCVVGCTSFWQKEASVIVVTTAECIIANQDLPDEQIAVKCGIDAANRVIMDLILNQTRAQVAAARAAAKAPDAGL